MDTCRQISGFALLGMATSARHSFSADAVAPVVVCRISRASFARFIENKPHLLRRINELSVRKLGQARDQLIPLKVPTEMISLPMSRQDIADFLSLTIETVNRIFTRLERDGVIEIIAGGVCLLDSAPAPAEALAAA